MGANIGWRKACTTSGQSPIKKAPTTALRDWRMWSCATTGCVVRRRGEHRSSAERSSKYETRRCKFAKPNRVRICIGVVLLLAFPAGERCSPLHGDTHPSGGRCANGCPHVQNYLETPIRFFLRPSAIFRSSEIHCEKPKQNEKTQTFRAAGNPKGLRPFWSF